MSTQPICSNSTTHSALTRRSADDDIVTIGSPSSGPQRADVRPAFSHRPRNNYNTTSSNTMKTAIIPGIDDMNTSDSHAISEATRPMHRNARPLTHIRTRSDNRATAGGTVHISQQEQRINVSLAIALSRGLTPPIHQTRTQQVRRHVRCTRPAYQKKPGSEQSDNRTTVVGRL